MDSTTLALDHADLIASVKPLTKCSTERLVAMCHALRHVDAKNLRGDVVECGVWQGANLILARSISPQRRCWAYDTFEGMPAPGPHDRSRSGVLAGQAYKGKSAKSREAVKDILRGFGCWDDNLVRLVPGLVEETLQDSENIPKRIAVLRLDTDWYDSTRIELETLYPRLVPGGVLIIDDFGHWLGARKAVEEYFNGHGPAWRELDYTGIMGIKPAQI
jgi:O-methyltransferase